MPIFPCDRIPDHMSKEYYSELLTAYQQHMRPGAHGAVLAETEELVINGRTVSLSFMPHELIPEEFRCHVFLPGWRTPQDAC